MKKLFALALVAGFFASFAVGCGGKPSTPASSTTITTGHSASSTTVSNGATGSTK